MIDPNRQPCSDCVNGRCNMNCGPSLPNDDPLGIKAAQKIAAGHLKLFNPTPQPAPESEDEAFERWWKPTFGDPANQMQIMVRDTARQAWNARSRLSAGGK